MLSHCQLKIASNFDNRTAQSALRSTDDFNFVGLILVCHMLSILLCLSLPGDDRHNWNTQHPIYVKWDCLIPGCY